MLKHVRNLMSVVMILVICSASNALAMTAENSQSKATDAKLTSAYNEIVTYAKESGIPLDLSFETFKSEFQELHYTDVSKYADSYYSILKPTQTEPANGAGPLSTSGSKKWYYNTGTSLPRPANYSKYDMLNKVKKGDIIFEKWGGYGITAHVAIVEGIFYSNTYKQSYIRIIEADNQYGVVRSVLDDERADDRGVTVLRVKNASDDKKSVAVGFCISQLGKGYNLDFKKDTSPNEPDWYCSELVWAGYYHQGINIETTGVYNEPGITPRDIKNCNRVSVVANY